LQSLLSNRMQKLLRSRRVWTHMKVRRSSTSYGAPASGLCSPAATQLELADRRVWGKAVALYRLDPPNTFDAANPCRSSAQKVGACWEGRVRREASFDSLATAQLRASDVRLLPFAVAGDRFSSLLRVM
ncbi:hypothetical protein NKH16_31560, partial [Mesorhizobium sp. M1307]|uniref:hypothetical protein n=1 Tax=Mesorhizobium sp. M1307 TaxID=2957079 RepID=UPI00333B5EDF